MYKKKLICLLLLAFTIFNSNAGYYSAQPSNFSFSNNASVCTANTYTISNIRIEMYSKTSVYLTFDFTFKNGPTYSYSEYGYFSGVNISVTFPKASFYEYCTSNIESRKTYFTPSLAGNGLGVSPIGLTLRIDASGYTSGHGTVGVSLAFKNNITPKVSASETMCSNVRSGAELTLDSYTPVYITFNGIWVNTVDTDNSFSLSNHFQDFLPSNYSITDGGSYKFRVEYNNRTAAVEATIKVHTPITNTSVISASKPTSCYGEAVNLNVSVPSGVNFAWSDGYGADKSPRPVNDSKEYYIIMSKSDGACQIQSNKISIQSIPNFTATISPDRTQACEEQTIQINASPNDANQYNYAWSTGANGSSISVNQSGNYNVTITPKNGGCSSKISNTVNNLSFEKKITGDDILLTNNKTKAIFCKDETNIVLSATASDLTNVSYQWNGPKTGNTKDLVIESGGEYTLQLFRGACSTNQKKITVIGKISPSLTLNPSDAQICKGQKISLIANPNNSDYSYQWFGGSDGTIDLKFSSVSYDATDGGVYRVLLNPVGGNCNATSGVYEVSQQVKADIPINNFQITGRKANDVVPICNLTNGINLEATSDNDVNISWNGGSKILKSNTVLSIKEENSFTAKFERGKCVEYISVTTKIQELLVNLKSTIDASRKYITCSDNTAFKLTAEPNFVAATVKWKDANDPNFLNINKEFAPTKAGKYFAVANLAECGTADSKPSNQVEVTVPPDFKVNIAAQLTNPICEGVTQTFTATPTYSAFNGSYTWSPSLSTSKILQSKSEGIYSLNILQDGCNASASVTIVTKASKPSIIVVDNLLISSLQTESREWLIKDLPSSTDPTLYKSFSPIETKDKLEAPKMGSYMLKGNRNGCGIAFSDPVDIFVLANENTSSNAWKVYPNPIYNVLTIENYTMDFKESNVIELRNSSGILVRYWFQNEKSKEYNVNDLSAGTYHLIFNQKNAKIVKKIIKL